MFNVTFTAAFLAGLVTFFAPCTFVTLPYFLSFLAAETITSVDTGPKSYKRRVFLSALLYVFGFLIVFTLLGYSASSFGRFLNTHREVFMKSGAILMLIFGAFIVIGDRIKFLHFLYHEKKIRHNVISESYSFPFIIGVTSAFAWTPCIGPLLGSILFLASYTTSKSIEGALLLLTYGLGITAPFLLLSLVTTYSEKWVRKLSRFANSVYIVSGIILIILSISILTGYSDVLFTEVYKVFIRLGYQPQ